MKIVVKRTNQVGDLLVTSNPTVGKVSLRTGVPGPIGPQGPAGNIIGVILNDTLTAAGNTTVGATANVANALNNLITQIDLSDGGTIEGPLTIEFAGEGLYVNANAQIVNDLRVGEVLRVGDFEITSNNFTTTADGEIVIDSFPSNLYSTIKYIVQVSNISGIHATEIFCMQNGVTIYATEYATLLSDAPKGVFSVELAGGTATLKFDLNNPGATLTQIHVLRHGLRF